MTFEWNMVSWIISSSVLIVVVIALRYLLRGKISLRLGYALWLLVALRLLLPFSIGDSPLSVVNIAPPQLAEAEGYIRPPGNYQLKVDDVVVYQGASRPSDQVFRELTAGAAYSVSALEHKISLGLFWLMGSLIIALTLLISNIRFAARLRRERRPFDCPPQPPICHSEPQAKNLSFVTDKILRRFVPQNDKEVGNDRVMPVYISTAVETPCLFGLLRPAIYLSPEVAANQTMRSHALAHELTHYRHGDHIWALLRCVCLCLHWYNPLAWWAAALSRRDAELACDEGTIRRLGEHQRQQYANTLIDLTCAKPSPASLLRTATTMNGGKRSIKERITLIAKRPQMAAYTLIALIIIAVVAVGCTFTGAEQEERPDAAAPSPAQPELFTVTSNGETVEPYLHPSSTQTWTEQGWVYGNGDGRSLKEVLQGELPTLTMGGDFAINFPANSSAYGGLNVYDQDLQPVEQQSNFELAAPWWLPQGEYICWMSVFQFGDYIDSQQASEISRYVLVFRLIVDEIVQPVPAGLDAAAAMEGVRAADLVSADEGGYVDGNITAAALAQALNAAVDHQLIDPGPEIIDDFENDPYPHWRIGFVWLSGGPESYSSEDLHFNIACGLMENVVCVSLRQGRQRDDAYFADEALYELVRHSWDYEEIVDSAAYARFEDILVTQMEETFALMSANPGAFSGYELTRFVQVWGYEDERDGAVVELYDFYYALLTDKHPREIGWAGGMYLDSKLRVQGFNGGGQLAVRYRDGEPVCTYFMGNDFSYRPQYDYANEEWAIMRLNEALDWAENNSRG